MTPYRDAFDERRERARARFWDLTERAKPAATLRYGLRARKAWRDVLAAFDGVDFQTVGMDVLPELERVLDEGDDVLATWVEEAREEARAAVVFQDVGMPSPEAMLFAKSGQVFRSGIQWDPAVAAELEPRVSTLTAAMPRGFLVDSNATGASFFFADDDGLPFRVDVSAKEGEEAGTYSVESTITSGRRSHRPRIAFRPQTFGDDILATLRIRRDPTFDDEAFDAVYFVSGNEQVLREVLTPEVRRAFVEIAREEPATLELADGIATMALGFTRLRSACALLRVLARAHE